MALMGAVGTKMEAVGSYPATDDPSGYEALSFTTVGKLSSVPDLNGTKDTANFDNLETGEEEKFADMLRAGNGEFNVGLDDTDAGQDIFETAFEGSGDTAKVSIKVTLKSGMVVYRKGIVTSYRETDIAPGNVVMATVGIEFVGSRVKVAAP